MRGMKIIKNERIAFETKEDADGKPVDVSTFEALAEIEGVQGSGKGSTKDEAETAARKNAAAAFAAKAAREA